MNHSTNSKLTVGVVSPSTNGSWLGGLYYLHHLIRACATLDTQERPLFRDVWWNEVPPADDPFAEVRAAMLPPVEIKLPRTLRGRLRRRLHRLLHGYRQPDLADLFHQVGIRVIFPILPCDRIGVPFVGWLTDFQYRHRHLAHYFTEEQLAALEIENRRVAGEARYVMLSSDDARRDMERFFPEWAFKARVVRPCSVPTPEWRQFDPRQTATRLGLPERFFLLPNQVCRHKNHRTVFEALRILAGRGVRATVVCSGKTADYRDPHFFRELQQTTAELGVVEQVRFVGALPRAEYGALVRRCLAVVQPSEFEGWGFAISDAKALGKPILASDIAIHQEHEAPRMRLVAVHDADAWADLLEQTWRESSPGPNAAAEEEATTLNAREALRVAGEMMDLFRAAL